MTLSASQIILEYICPSLGVITANVMFGAPYKSVSHAVEVGSLGPLNPAPWAFMTGATIGWITYSYVIAAEALSKGESIVGSFFIWAANGPGLIFSVWLNLAAAKLQYCDRVSGVMKGGFVQLLDKSMAMSAMKSAKSRPQLDKFKSTRVISSNARKSIKTAQIPARHEKLVLSIILFYLVLITSMTMAGANYSQWRVTCQIVVNINQCAFYGAPLSTIFTVIKTKDSTSIHRRTMILNTFNACFWTAYGFAVFDWALWLPNGIGALLGFVQLALRTIFPSKDDMEEDDESLTDIFAENPGPSNGGGVGMHKSLGVIEIDDEESGDKKASTTSTAKSVSFQ